MKTRILEAGASLWSGEGRHLLLLPDGGARRLLTLLHGAGEGPESFLHNSALAERAQALGLAVLLPALGNSFYGDWGEGQNALSCLLEELLPRAQLEAGLSPAPADNAVGGISMGGYGALRLALGEPGRFSRAFSLSGALDLKRSAQIFRICSLPLPGELGRLPAPLSLLEGAPDAGPALYLAWGEQDWFVRANRAFAGQALALGFPLYVSEAPGRHNWDYWRESLVPALRWAAE